jgi:AP-1-like factor
LTSEPTSKRKAQNRAAQRAFRERKEKHLKDLETKVEDLQKASESANHENSILRAQIEKMSTELREYKKRVSLPGNNARNNSSGVPSYLAGKGLGNTISNPNDVNFQFEFPRFGRLPGPPITNGSSSINGSRKSASASPASQQNQSPIDKTQISPRSTSLQYSVSNGSSSALTQTPAPLDGGDMASLSGLFSPTLLDSVSKSPPFEFFTDNSSNNSSRPSRSSTDSANGQSTGHNTSYSSPSASSNSGNGTISSCGTSPEPTTHQSPAASKPESSLTTIGEEQTENNLPAGETTFCEKLNMACGNPNNPIPRIMSEAGVNYSGNPETPDFDINGIDWFAQQNHNQFDPQLFGDYREPQDNVLSNDPWGDTFFTEALATDFTSPFNMAPSPAAKKDLIHQIDEAQEGEEEVVPGEDRSQLLTCNTIWDRLQACPRVQEGGFDLDLLCSDLQKKAKCSETGAVVNETDFNKIIQKYVRVPADSAKANKAK